MEQAQEQKGQIHRENWGESNTDKVCDTVLIFFT